MRFEGRGEPVNTESDTTPLAAKAETAISNDEWRKRACKFEVEPVFAYSGNWNAQNFPMLENLAHLHFNSPMTAKTSCPSGRSMKAIGLGCVKCKLHIRESATVCSAFSPPCQAYDKHKNYLRGELELFSVQADTLSTGAKLRLSPMGASRIFGSPIPTIRGNVRCLGPSQGAMGRPRMAGS